jgi:hypothetical protein
MKETSFPLSSVNINASDGELGHIIHCSQATTLLWLQVRTTAFYALNYILLWKKWLMRIMRASFQSYCPQNPVVIKQTSLSTSFSTYETTSMYKLHRIYHKY